MSRYDSFAEAFKNLDIALGDNQRLKDQVSVFLPDEAVVTQMREMTALLNHRKVVEDQLLAARRVEEKMESQQATLTENTLVYPAETRLGLLSIQDTTREIITVENTSYGGGAVQFSIVGKNHTDIRNISFGGNVKQVAGTMSEETLQHISAHFPGPLRHEPGK